MIIAEFDKTTGVIKAGAGYEDISSFRVTDLKNILERIKPGTEEVRLAYAPYRKDGQSAGSALLVKPRGSEESHWLYVSPMRGKDKQRYHVPICDILPEDL